MTIALLATFAAAFGAPVVNRLGPKLTGWVLAIIPGAWFVWLLTEAQGIRDGAPITETVEWVPSLKLNLAFHIDGLSMLMALIVTGVGAFVLIYAGSYFERGYANVGRFFAFLLAFIAAMLGLVIADNILSLFVFWELTSILSFLLVGFHHTNAEARTSAQQALFITAGGGLLLLGGLLLVGIDSGAWEFSTMRAEGYAAAGAGIPAGAITLVAIGAFTKSAQFPFHLWLPNAMVAPTPVSAYLHSAAMVKAGVYILVRFYPSLGGHDLWPWLLVPAGGATMLIGAWLAIKQNDLKRILAYTTISALGSMVLLIGIGGDKAIKAAIVLLVGHAMYKGALFMAAGSIDHGAGTRDVRRLRGLARAMPYTSLAVLLASVSMAGIPPTLGYLGKETLIAASIGWEPAAIPLTVAVIANGVLAFAAAGLLVLKPLPGHSDPADNVHEDSFGLWLGPVVLAIGGVLVSIYPEFIVEWMLRPATFVGLGAESEVELHLIPDDPAIILISVATLGLGALLSFLMLKRPRLRYRASLPPIADRVYGYIIDGLNTLARGFTLVAQNGNLNVYLAVTLAITVALVALPMFVNDGWRRPSWPSDLHVFEVALALLIVTASIGAAVIRSRMAAVASLSVLGYGVALIYAINGAPDLAMTQILVETLTILLFVFVFLRLPGIRVIAPRLSRIRDALAAIVVGVMVTGLAWAVQSEDTNRSISEFYATAARPLAHGRNVVNTILVDFRALDTLGEITVLAIAAVGVIALLRFGRGDEGNE